MPGLTAVPEFPQLVPHIHVQPYARDGGHSHPRYRLELRNAAPLDIRTLALGLTMPCVACGRAIHPFRERGAAPAGRGSDQAQTVYLAVACPLAVNVGCSRGGAARDEYIRIREAVDAWGRNNGGPSGGGAPPAPPDIFGMQED